MVIVMIRRTSRRRISNNVKHTNETNATSSRTTEMLMLDQNEDEHHETMSAIRTMHWHFLKGRDCANLLVPDWTLTSFNVKRCTESLPKKLLLLLAFTPELDVFLALSGCRASAKSHARFVRSARSQTNSCVWRQNWVASPGDGPCIYLTGNIQLERNKRNKNVKLEHHITTVVVAGSSMSNSAQPKI